uniref:Uncharacterized protein n=1 Tax=Percolomonas cosmopolitus TaxID=63605 RepID=A0A7S1KSS4_9EUKA
MDDSLPSHSQATFTLKPGKYTSLCHSPFYANCTLLIHQNLQRFTQHVLYKERSSQLFFNFTREGIIKEVTRRGKVSFQVTKHVADTQQIPRRVIEIAGIAEEDESQDSVGMFFEARIDAEDSTWLRQVDIGKGAVRRKLLDFKVDDANKDKMMWEKRLFEMGG